VSLDRYAGAGERWATGATLVYAPIASELVAMSPHPLAGRRVLDIGAGTGVASAALLAQGARPIPLDLSVDMLTAWNAAQRPPSVVADVRALPIGRNAVDDVIASFVLNHLTDPARGFGELVRVVRPGGAVLATVYGTANRSSARDRVDKVAKEAGWQVPEWYLELKTEAVPLLGSAASMKAAARRAGLVEVVVEERPVDVGVTRVEDLVEYRFGQAHFTAWLDEIGPRRAGEVRRRAAHDAEPIFERYCPVVVFLSAIVAGA
jgi:ubiquinone/menaquinone biosynthesis C-methylase UbiE